jgi:hypothetical protein
MITDRETSQQQARTPALGRVSTAARKQRQRLSLPLTYSCTDRRVLVAWYARPPEATWRTFCFPTIWKKARNNLEWITRRRRMYGVTIYDHLLRLFVKYLEIFLLRASVNQGSSSLLLLPYEEANWFNAWNVQSWKWVIFTARKIGEEFKPQSAFQ